jgi:hypothetical protein
MAIGAGQLILAGMDAMAEFNGLRGRRRRALAEQRHGCRRADQHEQEKSFPHE